MNYITGVKSTLKEKKFDKIEEIFSYIIKCHILDILLTTGIIVRGAGQ